MEIQTLKDSQGAMVIFCDMVNDDSSIVSTCLDRCFSSQEYMYTQKNKFPAFNELIGEIKKNLDNYDLIRPSDKYKNNMVFAYYVELKDLTEDWIKDFFECAHEFQKKVDYEYPEQQRHFIYIRFTAAGLEPEVFKAKAEFVKKLINEGRDISKEVFILRRNILDSFGDQEKGLSLGLFLQSRRDNFGYQINYNYLMMVSYEDYSDQRAAKCREKIEKIEKWLKESKDDELADLSNEIKAAVNSSLKELARCIQLSDLTLSLYPVNKEDFEEERFLFWVRHYRSTISKNNPILIELKKDAVSKSEKKILDKVDCKSIKRLLEEQYYYNDLKKVRDILIDPSKREEYFETLKEQILKQATQRIPGKEDFVAKLINAVLDRINENEYIKNLDKGEKSIHIRNIRSMNLYNIESREAETYKNLTDCFDKIDAHANLPMINNAVTPAETFKIAIINNACVGILRTGANEISGFEIAYSYQNDYEVTIMKNFMIVDMEKDNCDQTLMEILV